MHWQGGLGNSKKIGHYVGEMGTREISKKKTLVGLYPPLDSSWHWKKLCAIKDSLKPKQLLLLTQSHKHYTLKMGYE